MQPEIRPILEQLDRSPKAESADGIWELLRTVHAAPVLREWVTLEAIPLQPTCTSIPGRPGEALLFVFLSCPDLAGKPQMPWTLVCWHLPSQELLGVLKTPSFFKSLASPFEQQHLATPAFCMEMDKAIAEDSAITPPPPSLERLYSELLARCPWKAEMQALGAAVASGVKKQPESEEPQVFENSESITTAIELLQVSDLLRTAREVISKTGQESLLAQWRRIYGMLSRSAFTVAVVGEFSRGKSTLINNILRADIVPIGDMPTTAMLTRIRAGETPTLLYLKPDGSRVPFPITPETWEHLAKCQVETPGGVVDITIPNTMLQDSAIELIDTPGVNALMGPQAVSVGDAIANCEAAVVVVNATMALSLTERSFIEEHIRSKRIPRIAVALARLDQVEAADRLRVIQFTKSKLAEWAPEAELWLANEAEFAPSDHNMEVIGAAQIIAKLGEWARGSDRTQLQYQQILAQLSSMLVIARGFLAAQRQVKDLTAEARKQQKQKAEALVKRRRLDWEEIRIESKQLELRSLQWLETALNKSKTTLVENLTFQAEGSADLRNWWEEKLPFLLRRELAGLNKSISIEVIRRLNAHAKYLAKKATDQFEQELQFKVAEDFAIPIDVQGLGVGGENRKLQDLSKTQRMIQIGFTGLTAASLFFPGGLILRAGALLGSALSGLAFGKVMKGKIAEQKGTLRTALNEAMDGVFITVLTDFKPQICAYYSSLVQCLYKREALWFETQIKAIEEAEYAVKQGPDGDAAAKALNQTIAEIEGIEAAIKTIQ